MPRFEDACPFDAQSRANRCKGCLATNGVPPCAAAFLSGRARLETENVVQLRRVEVTVPQRRAA